MIDPSSSYPGDNIVSDPLIQLTYHIDIESHRSEIWPWLVQVGYHRGGWYIDKWTDRIEQKYFWPLLVPREVRGTWKAPSEVILPEYQGLKVGDKIPDGPPGSPYYNVVLMKSQRFLVLHATTHIKYLAPGFLQGTRFEPSGEWSWAFILDPISESSTRLISRWRGKGEPRLYLNLIKPFLWLIDRHQQREILKGIKRRVESSRRK